MNATALPEVPAALAQFAAGKSGKLVITID
jgi:hypothetical protein